MGLRSEFDNIRSNAFSGLLMPKKAISLRSLQSAKPAKQSPAIGSKPKLTTAQKGYGGAWQRFSSQFLREHPMCVICEQSGRIVPATECDHVIPHKGDKSKFWNGPFQGLCESCHARKSAKEKD